MQNGLVTLTVKAKVVIHFTLSRRSGVAEAIGYSGGNCNSGNGGGSNGDSGNSCANYSATTFIDVCSELFT